jgi:hypothetical protein
MNVVILAADGFDEDSVNAQPRCFSQHVGDVSLVERQLRVLSLYGIERKRVTLVIGAEGAWKDSIWSEHSRNLGCNVVVNPTNASTRSGHSLKLALISIGFDSPCLVISGDLNFDTKHIDTLLGVGNGSKALVRQALSVGEKGILISLEDDLVTLVGDAVRDEMFPWSVFCGMVFAEAALVDLYLKCNDIDKDISYLSMLHKLKGSLILSGVDYIQPNTITHSFSSTAKDLTGGSFASLRKRHLIRKYSDTEGADKLIDEIKWLTALPPSLKYMFPTVVDYSLDGEIWFDMPFYDVPNIRKNILSGRYNVDQIVDITKKVLDFTVNHLYQHIVSKTPFDWVKEKHIDRVEDRLLKTVRSAPVFSDILNAKNIIINGTSYRNLPDLFFKLKHSPKFLTIVTPDSLRMIHGDLHYQNILLTDQNEDFPFTLADPRGELDGSDVYYDLGKLWHSFNGMYDLVHTDQYEIGYEFPSPDTCDVNLQLGTNEIRETYRLVHHKVESMMSEFPFIVDDKNWLMKTKFNEVMHFSSVIIFHLFDDGIEKRGLTLYFIAVRLINEFFNEFSDLLGADDPGNVLRGESDCKTFLDSVNKLDLREVEINI